MSFFDLTHAPVATTADRAAATGLVSMSTRPDFVVLDFLMSFFLRLFFSSILFSTFLINAFGYVNAKRSWYFTLYTYSNFRKHFLFFLVFLFSRMTGENLKNIHYSSIMPPKRGCSETITYPQQNVNGTHHFSGLLVVTSQSTYR